MAGDAARLRHGALSVDLDRRGAVMTAFAVTGLDGRSTPLLRDAAGYDGDPLKASCFPLLPFGNRVRDNRFSCGGETYHLTPNQSWDRHYLHGDGWLGLWQMETEGETGVRFTLRQQTQAGRPYAYDAAITYRLTDDGALKVTLSVRNAGSQPLPFGLGLHPYFPLAPQTMLCAKAAAFFPEQAEYLPGPRTGLPPDLDFNQKRRLPRRWVNAGFTGWDGAATILWPERQLSLQITADAAFHDYFVFMSDRSFEPDFAEDYFCFEPMTHQADGHHAADLGGLVVLAPDQTLSGTIIFKPQPLTGLAGSLA